MLAGVTLAFALRRARDRAALLVALAATAAVLVAALGGFAAVSDRLLDDGVTRLVADADPAARSLVVDGPLRGQEQSDAVAHSLAEAFPDAIVERRVWVTAPGAVASAGDADAMGRIRVLADLQITAHAHLVEGAWPAAPGEAAVGAPAARKAGLEVGAELRLGGGATLRVVGVWEADDVRDTAWVGEPSVASGVGDGAIGPVLVGESILATLGPRPRVAWVITPAPVSAAALPELAANVHRVHGALDEIDPGGSDGMRVSGGLGDTIARATTAATGARALLAVPLIALGAVGALMLGVLARTLASARREQLRLLRARGTSLWQLGAAATTEAAICAGAGALVGGVVAVLGAGSSPGPVVILGVTVLLLTAGLTVAATMPAAALAGGGGADTDGGESGSAESARQDAGRRSVAVLIGPVIAVAAVATLALAQLVSRGLVVRGELDPLAAVAPTLLLIAGALLAALLAGPVAAIAQRLARQGRGLGLVLALRRIARQSGTVAVAVIAVTLATASLVFVGLTTAAATHAGHDGVAAFVGADARGRFSLTATIGAGHAGVRADGLDAFSAVVRAVRIGTEDATLVATPVARQPTAVNGDGDGLGDMLTEPGGVGVAPAAGPLHLTMTASTEFVGSAVAVDVAVWLIDPDGAAVRSELGEVTADSTAHELSVDVVAGLRVVAVEVTGVRAGSEPVTVTYTGVDAAGATLFEGSAARAVNGRPARVPVGSPPDAVPVALTATLAERLGVGVGDPLSISGGSIAPPIPARVAAIQPQLPGLSTSPGVLADQATFTAVAVARGGSVLAANELWAHAESADDAEAALRAAATAPVQVLTAASVGTATVTDPVLRLAAVTVAVAAALAVVTFGVVVAAQVRRRRAEAVPLRSFGFTLARQRAAAVLEAAIVAVYAVLAGTAVGAVVAGLTGPFILAPVIGVIAG